MSTDFAADCSLNCEKKLTIKIISKIWVKSFSSDLSKHYSDGLTNEWYCPSGRMRGKVTLDHDRVCWENHYQSRESERYEKLAHTIWHTVSVRHVCERSNWIDETEAFWTGIRAKSNWLLWHLTRLTRTLEDFDDLWIRGSFIDLTARNFCNL